MVWKTTRPNENSERRRKILFVVTEDWYFVSHRLPLALGAMKAGMDVAVATNVAEHGELIKGMGIELHPWRIKRGSTHLWFEFQALCSLAKIYRRVNPDVVHQVAIKPVIYGSLAAKFARRPKLVNALGGMGSLFTAREGQRSLLRSLVLAGFRALLSTRGSALILQNPDDRDLLIKACCLRESAIHLIRGAGVDTKTFAVEPEPDGVPVVVLPARMLADKGIFEYVAAARELKAQGIKARFLLVGGNDECNPANISVEKLQAWVSEGVVEWLGRRNDMPAILAASTIVCLPSYREGLPKALLEAAACGRPIITTDVPGCREVVHHGENGLLVPARDAKALSAAIAGLLENSDLRLEMGRKSRQMALSHFSEESVVRDTLDVYLHLLAGSSVDRNTNWNGVEKSMAE